MSGIAGVFSPNHNNILPKMLSKIKHRGSEKPILWKSPFGELGAVALVSINERPFAQKADPGNPLNGETAIVWDGRLVSEMAQVDGIQYFGDDASSHAEVVLQGYEDLGTRLFGRLEGEFALAIMDNERLLLARDRLGISPLYYGFHEGALFFASEIKALVDIVDMVLEFPPGHYLASDRGLFPFQPYFPKPVRLDGALDSAGQLAVQLKEGVRRVIPEGVEVGVWLSGGVDSSVIAALARPYVDKLYTFSAGVENAPDLEYARMVADHIGATHYERIYGMEEMLSVMEETICSLESFDAPLVHSSISNYLVAKLASEYVPFVLSGEGGDELFAGYAYQKSYNSELELTLSIQNAIAALHNTALQRVDRMAAAHQTDAAVPFLDPDVVRYALAIPARWKIRGEQPVDKWPLRRGLEDWLPNEVIWRGKSKFWEGSGVGQRLSDHASQVVSDQEFEDERDLGGGEQLKSKEELLYYRIFKGIFGDKVPLSEIGRTQFI
jgi:asparagine synthase (glutamine-hydrolysing)